MANASSAFGTVTVTAENNETAQRIVEIINCFTSQFGCPTEFEVEDGTAYDNSFECSFYGDGHWKFQNNIKSLGTAIKDRKSINLALVEELEHYEFTIEFSYTDDGLNSDFLCERVDLLTHKKDTPLDQMIFEEKEYTELNDTEEEYVA